MKIGTAVEEWLALSPLLSLPRRWVKIYWAAKEIITISGKTL